MCTPTLTITLGGAIAPFFFGGTMAILYARGLEERMKQFALKRARERNESMANYIEWLIEKDKKL